MYIKCSAHLHNISSILWHCHHHYCPSFTRSSALRKSKGFRSCHFLVKIVINSLCVFFYRDLLYSQINISFKFISIARQIIYIYIQIRFNCIFLTPFPLSFLIYLSNTTNFSHRTPVPVFMAYIMHICVDDILLITECFFNTMM